MTLVLKGGALYVTGGGKRKRKKKATKSSIFHRLVVDDFVGPMHISYKIYDVAGDGNCFFYSLLRGMAAKDIACSFDEIFDIRSTEPSEPTDIFDGLIHDNLNLLKNDELEAGKFLRRKLHDMFTIACNLYNQTGNQVSADACINELVENIREIKNFAHPFEPHKTLLRDLGTFGNYMETGNPLLQKLIQCALKVKVRVYSIGMGTWVEYLKNEDPFAPDVVNIMFTGDHYKFMQPNNGNLLFQGKGRLRRIFKAPSKMVIYLFPQNGTPPNNVSFNVGEERVNGCPHIEDMKTVFKEKIGEEGMMAFHVNVPTGEIYSLLKQYEEKYAKSGHNDSILTQIERHLVTAFNSNSTDWIIDWELSVREFANGNPVSGLGAFVNSDFQKFSFLHPDTSNIFVFAFVARALSSSSSSSSVVEETLSEDLQSLVDDGSITLEDARQLMKTL